MKNRLLSIFVIFIISIMVSYAQDKLLFDGKCPVCKDRGMVSEVYSGSTMTTLLAGTSYYDTNGVYQYDNPNTTTTRYSCSKGHLFDILENSSGSTLKIIKTNDVVSIDTVIPYMLEKESNNVMWNDMFVTSNDYIKLFTCTNVYTSTNITIDKFYLCDVTNYPNPFRTTNNWKTIIFNPLEVKDSFDTNCLFQLMEIWRTNGTICANIGHYWKRRDNYSSIKCIICERYRWPNLPWED